MPSPQAIETNDRVPQRTIGGDHPSPRCLLVALALALTLGPFAAQSARADLKLCNGTTGRIGVAIGYQEGSGWATEGWWTIAGETCETLLKGKLGSRFYYVHAIDYDRGGEWAGKTIMCTSDKAFWIKGNTECEKRGHMQSGFMEVDTNDAQDWTIRLVEPVEARK